MPSNHLHTIFYAIIVSRILYALPATCLLPSLVELHFLSEHINVDFCKELLAVNELLVESGTAMFKKMKSPMHCHYVTPCLKIGP